MWGPSGGRALAKGVGGGFPEVQWWVGQGAARGKGGQGEAGCLEDLNGQSGYSWGGPTAASQLRQLSASFVNDLSQEYRLIHLGTHWVWLLFHTVKLRLVSGKAVPGVHHLRRTPPSPAPALFLHPRHLPCLMFLPSYRGRIEYDLNNVGCRGADPHHVVKTPCISFDYPQT